VTSRFGALLRKWRQRAGLSQEALAERAELGIRTIRGLETGERRDPRVGTVRLLADALRLNGAERAELFAAAGRAEPPSAERAPAELPPAEGVAAQRVSAGRAAADEPGGRGGATSQSPRGPALIADPLVEAADALAYAVHARWQREEEQRQIHDPVPLPVGWYSVHASLRDSWANIRMAKPGETVRQLDLGGRLDQIVEVYQRIPSRRLVVLGRAGSGKTILTMRFVLDLLAMRDPADPVPVIFSLGSWNPTRTGLRDWLAEQLVRDHPGLAAPGPGGATLAVALVDAHRVLPVLDGFDEMTGGLHRAALVALNATTLPLLLTSRVDEYRAAVDATDVLTAAGTVELADLTAADLADYLPRTTQKTGHAGNVWQPVLDEVRDHPDGALAAVLTTPLMVALARRIYSDTPDHDPGELLDADRFGAREAIERYLLGSFVPAVYQGRRGTRTYDIDHVRRWLGYLADHLSRLGTHDLAWWQLGTSTRRRTRALVVALGVGVGVGLADMLVEGILLGMVTTRLLVFATMIGLVAGALSGLVHGHLVGAQPLQPVQARIRLRGWSGQRWPRVWSRFRLGLLFGGLLGASYGVVRALALWFVSDEYQMSIAVLLDAGVFATVFGAGAALIFGLVAAVESPLDIRSAGSPAGLLRANRRAVLVQVLLFVPVFAVFVAVTTWLIARALMSLPRGGPFGLEIVWSPTIGLVLGLIGGLGGGLVYVLSMTAWGQWVVFVRVWLPLTGRLPWAVHGFLDDVYRRGVLRRSGAVYQFRHARLQDHLTEAYRRFP
jgi:transcriptional regulator with XRE-family HTH domain